MPTPEFHINAAINAAAPSIATNGVISALAGYALGVDFPTWMWAFLGATAWRFMQPAITANYDNISKAFGLALISMMIGTLGSLIVAHYGFNQPLVAGLIAYLGAYIIPILVDVLAAIKAKLIKLIEGFKGL